ncbi:hypothetical protein [Nioella nitratireducens]|uniref:hypothetical protein n=1 Tax=Nioella nitratireducens TaxID=1287720 RepID=UPI0008FD5E6E|nr:hypothetical protein [Nioella nitratireducens]
MPVSFRIFPKRGLVLVRYWGRVTLEESARAFGCYASDPEFRPGQDQLVDLSGVTAFEKDYLRFMAMQAEKAEILLASGARTLLVFYAPSAVSREIAETTMRSWEPSDKLVPMMQEDEADALALLGQRETRIEDLLQTAR